MPKTYSHPRAFDGHDSPTGRDTPEEMTVGEAMNGKGFQVYVSQNGAHSKTHASLYRIVKVSEEPRADSKPRGDAPVDSGSVRPRE
jgi:hypothetical protein